ncbi:MULTISPECIES: chemotaxis protein CheD [Bacillus]|uniref:Chemoreceptor glutamine deamidase CheD n=2 Tax=Bacillus TaxID=1386 RepID=A0A0M5JLE0_9BACI|nr:MULTISPECIES: chemotaxis protein CheD [Bacillus]ALC81077.1 chemotaxis protein CheD [Bacillus gobiensis]MBP1080038.1 chemotaxis protein CheD [Bacillus capparidis]MED1095427.1 chemotaxis protein CheD [Bacillus capparidis]
MSIVEPEIVTVGISDLKIAAKPNRLRTSGLGSCIGLVIYDSVNKTAGMVHIMLPDSSFSKTSELNKAKYADTAVQYLVEMLESAGCEKSSLLAKMAGGSEMFKFSYQPEIMRIGPRNVEAVKNNLSLLNIPIVSSDTGGTNGRTIEFDMDTENLTIRTVTQGVKVI